MLLYQKRVPNQILSLSTSSICIIYLMFRTHSSLNVIIPEACSKPNRIQHLRWGFLQLQLTAFNDCFRKKLHFRCLNGFTMRFYFMPPSMRNVFWKKNLLIVNNKNITLTHYGPTFHFYFIFIYPFSHG